MARSVSPEGFADILIQTSAGFSGQPVLFPASDEFAFLVAQARELLAEQFAFHWNSAETILKLFDKAEMIHFCQQVGILCPKTHVTGAVEDIRLAAQEFPFPCVVKPLRSFRTAFPSGQKNYVAASVRDLLRFYERYPDLVGATIWQEVIDGPDEEIYQCNVLVTESGAVRAICGVRKLRQYPTGFGNMCFGRTETNGVVASASLKLLRLLRYRGFASIEFKRRASDNRYYFIEMNARLPRYCGLLGDAGLNLPHLGYLDLTSADRRSDHSAQQNDDVYWLTVREDFLAARESGALRPRTLLPWIRSISQARSFAWWDRHDPLPFAHSILKGRASAKANGSPTLTPSGELGDSEHRRFFESQYASPHEIDVGTERFFIYDISPTRLESAVPILFCPGWMENPQNHKETIYALYREGRRTIFPDSPHGIEAECRRSLRMAELRKAAVLTATMRLREISEADAIAHSEGAINLTIAATAEGAPRIRNIVLHSPAGLCGAGNILGGAWRARQETRQQRKRQAQRSTERQLLRDPSRRRMYFCKTLAQTLAEARAIAEADIRDMLVYLRRRGTGIAIIHGADDRLFRMEEMQKHVDAGMVDGFYSVKGGHQQILLEPSRHARLASDVLLALERKRDEYPRSV
jgi:D-aspartate ligase